MAGYQVAECSVAKEQRGMGVLQILWEAYGVLVGQLVSPTLPPDQYELSPAEVNPDIRKHPLFAGISDDDMRAIDDFANGINPSTNRPEPPTPPTTRYESQLSATGKTILNLIRRGTSTYYLAMFTYSWTKAYWTLPSPPTRGGTIETPGGPLASSLPPGIAWLRAADDVRFTGQYFLLTKRWIGGPAGHWDADLYAE